MCLCHTFWAIVRIILPIYRLSTSSEQLQHNSNLPNNIILDNKKEITAPILCIGAGCHGVPDGIPWHPAPMHNIGAIMADALLNGTDYNYG